MSSGSWRPFCLGTQCVKATIRHMTTTLGAQWISRQWYYPKVHSLTAVHSLSLVQHKWSENIIHTHDIHICIIYITETILHITLAGRLPYRLNLLKTGNTTLNTDGLTRICTLQWRHNKCDGVSNHRRLDCLLSHLFRRRSKKTSKLRFTGPMNSPRKGP